MIKTDFEPYCDNCPYMSITDDEVRLCRFDEKAVVAYHVITCTHADICRRIADKIREEDNDQSCT